MIHQDLTTPVKGLDAFPEDEIPTQVNAVFQFYHLMVAIGMLLIALSLYAGFLWWRGKLFNQRWLMWVFVLGCFLASNCQSGRMVCCGNGSSALGGLRTFENL